MHDSGHIRVATNPKGDTFQGTCPYHGSCVEGMCASGALCARKGGISVDELATLSDDDPVWDQCAYQLGQVCTNLVLIASPDRIRFGGGVMNRLCLYPKIRVCCHFIVTRNCDGLCSIVFLYNGAGMRAGVAGWLYSEERTDNFGDR